MKYKNRLLNRKNEMGLETVSLLSEAPGGRGVVALLNRNPSLSQGSIQKVFITKIKTDVTAVDTPIIKPEYKIDNMVLVI